MFEFAGGHVGYGILGAGGFPNGFGPGRHLAVPDACLSYTVWHMSAVI